MNDDDARTQRTQPTPRPQAIGRFLVAAIALAAASPAGAVGFGSPMTRTGLGQALDFVAPVMLEPGEDVSGACVTAEVRAGDARVAPPNVRVVLEGPTGAPRRVRVTTSVAIDEPVVSIDISIGCGSKVSRRFVSFMDPPELRLARVDAEPASPAESRVDRRGARGNDAARQADTATASAPAIADTPAREPRRVDRRVARRASGRTRVATARGGAAPTSRGRPASARETTTRVALASGASAGPRLRLDAPDPQVLRPAAATPPVATDTPSPADVESPGAAAALQRERERIQSLETAIARVRADSQATQKTVAALQARLRQAESDRYSNVVVYALGAAALLFALLASSLWLLRPRQRRRASWFDAKAAANREAKAEPAAEPADAFAAAGTKSLPISQPAPWHVASDSLPLNTRPATIGGLDVTTVLAPSASRDSFPMVVDAIAPSLAVGPLSMEELIDLEQQAEFFVVLGQEEAAIALLENYVDCDGQSPLPYLQLLELQQKRGDTIAFEIVRGAFSTRFGAEAPEWSATLGGGRSLEAYPQTVARIQALWPTPLSAMQALDAVLFRRQSSDDAFDFPAYRELLFLYSIARELAGQVETDFGAIDLFLPLDDAPAAAGLSPTPAGNGIDFDVSRWDENESATVTPIRRAG